MPRVPGTPRYTTRPRPAPTEWLAKRNAPAPPSSSSAPPWSTAPATAAPWASTWRTSSPALPGLLTRDPWFSYVHVDDVVEGPSLAADKGRVGRTNISPASTRPSPTFGRVAAIAAAPAAPPVPVGLARMTGSALDVVSGSPGCDSRSAAKPSRSALDTGGCTQYLAPGELGWNPRPLGKDSRVRPLVRRSARARRGRWTRAGRRRHVTVAFSSASYSLRPSDQESGDRDLAGGGDPMTTTPTALGQTLAGSSGRASPTLSRPRPWAYRPGRMATRCPIWSPRSSSSSSWSTPARASRRSARASGPKPSRPRSTRSTAPSSRTWRRTAPPARHCLSSSSGSAPGTPSTTPLPTAARGPHRRDRGAAVSGKRTTDARVPCRPGRGHHRRRRLRDYLDDIELLPQA